MWNARFAMKENLTICLAFGLLVFSSQAQESASGLSATPLGAEGPIIATTSADDAAYAALLKSNLELNAQFKLLSNLAQEHRKLAEEAAKANQAEKALWENDLAKELSDRSSALLKQLSDVTKQRLAFEKAPKNAAVSAGSLNAAITATRLSSHEVEFLSKLDEGLQRVEQELRATRQDASAYAAQISTNTMPYDFERAAYILDQNTRKVRQLEQEHFDLELRKLEFQALRRP
jgi:hypothetical protein